MGANNFEDRVVAATAEEGFRALGGGSARGAYAGDISCKTKFRMEAPQKGESPLECVARCSKDPEHFSDDKWGPAACVDLGEANGRPGCRVFCFFGWAPS